MRSLWAALLGTWLLATPAAAQLPATDRAAIEGVIQDQMAAFGRDDAAAAYAHAAPGIQALFPSPEIFLEMVRRAYRPVYRPADVSFRPPEVVPEGILQKVLVRGPDGRLVMAHYTMERGADGGWKIAGCTLLELPEEGA
jgi:hypothetical protein